MSEIYMKYIMIQKQKTDKSIKDMVLEILNKSYCVGDNKICICINGKEYNIEYTLMQKSGDDRCYFELYANIRVDKALMCLEDLNDKLKTSTMQKYFCILKSYDGISNYYCRELYPEYAKYERNLRHMIHLMVTKCYGNAWADETINSGNKSEIVQRARKKNFHEISLDVILECLDLHELEDYLFEAPEIDLKEFINKYLSSEKLKNLTKEEICDLLISVQNPRCLWERLFLGYGERETWKKELKNVHDARNTVAHHKTMDKVQFSQTKHDIAIVLTMIDNTIDKIMTEDFDERAKIDILNTLVPVIDGIVDITSVKEILSTINERVQEMVKPIEFELNSKVIDTMKKTSDAYKNINFDSLNLTLGKLDESLDRFQDRAKEMVEQIDNNMKKY